MTSKEALKRIETAFAFNREGKESVYREYTNSVYNYYEDFDLIMRDLEVLEILKKHLIITDIQIDNLYNKIYLKEMMNDDIKTIKEWLKDE